MLKSLKTKWLKALRSRKYRQVQGALKKNIIINQNGKVVCGHCCLGVLCDIVDKNGWQEEEDLISFIYDNEIRSSTLPYKLEMALNISDKDTTKLINMNDTKGQKFYQIARWIERNL